MSDAEDVSQRIALSRENITVKIARCGTENPLDQCGGVFLNEIRLFATEEIQWVNLSLGKTLPECSNGHTRHSLVLSEWTVMRNEWLGRGVLAPRNCKAILYHIVVGVESQMTKELPIR
jgi:hypothetical protein